MKKLGINKIGINRLLGILVTLGIFVAAFIIFNLMTYLQMDRQIKELEQVSMTYNRNYTMYRQTYQNLEDYNEKISQKANELAELEQLMKKHALSYSRNSSTLTFSGVVNSEKFASILNFLSAAKTLKINTLDTKSQTELPLLIGESKAPDMYIKEMEVELIQTDDKILEG